MSSTIQRFQNQRQLYWKCKKTSVSIEFFDCKLYLPVPFSIVLVLWSLFFLPILKLLKFQTKKKVDNDHLSFEQLKARKKHAQLMQDLIARLISKGKMQQKMYFEGKDVKRNESKC